MKRTPDGWSRVTSALFYEDAGAAIDWLCRAFGFSVRLKVEGDGGVIEHSQLECGGGVVMVSTARKAKNRQFCVSPRSIGGANTQSLAMYVDDVEAQCERARAAGAAIAMEPETQDYGEDYWADRTCEVVDIEGHHWFFMQRLRG